ncbi:MAG: hypothetical protein MUE51_03870 [Thermoleophilia bacterium]|nr:hypothetical protein [Thermoleophilia bacterium]
MSQTPEIVRRWEDLPIGVQLAAAFVVSLGLLFAAHVTVLNQPTGRGFMYAIFWAVPLTGVIVAATRSERARRLRAEAERAARRRAELT